MTTDATSPVAALEALDATLDGAFTAARDEHELRVAYARVLGREGTLNALMKRIPELPGAERKSFGQRVNAVKQRAEKLREDTERRLRADARARELARPAVDVTLPGRRPRGGKLHPLQRVLYEVVDVFAGLGFDVAEGPEVDYPANNFERLGFPADHPAMDMQDTFFVDGAAPGERALLRTHTSTVQIREMLSHKPPVMIVAPGAVYRRDDDVTHSPMFFQLEGLVVDKGVSMAHLKGVLALFVERLFGRKLNVKLRASYFPFTEPSAEMDVECPFCQGADPSCRVCKGSGWIEVLGCGMVDPRVFSHVDYDSEGYSGFAFGLGIDRLTMLKYRVPDIRLLYENDVRFLESV